MTEEERLVALGKLRDWTRDKDIALMVAVVLRVKQQPSIGHLARFCPDEFDALFEEMEAMAD